MKGFLEKEEEEEGESELGKKRCMVDMDVSKFEVNKETQEIILKEDTFIYIPCSECATELDTQEDTIITLLNHLEREFKNEEGENYVRYHSKGYLRCLL
jgi:hypothetical protein